MRDLGILPIAEIGGMEIGIRKEETAKWKQDRQSRKEELGIRKKTMNEELGLRFRYTWDIIEAAERGLLPDKGMLNVHPQRWTDRPLPWVKEFVGQNFKNVMKKWMIRMDGWMIRMKSLWNLGWTLGEG